MKTIQVSKAAWVSSLLLLGSSHIWANESRFEIYGVADLAYGYQSNGLPPNANNGASIVSTVFSNSANPQVGAHTGFWNGGISQDRLGLKGSTPLFTGWTAGFLAETGVNLLKGQLVNNAQGLVNNSGTNSATYQTTSTNGSQNGQLINREGYVYLDHGGLGALRVGRNNTLINDAAQEFDPTVASPIFGFLTASSGFGGGSGISETTRLNNSVKYLNQLGPVKVGAFYAKGDNTALAKQGRSFGFGLGYVWNDFKIQYAHTTQTDAIKESVSSTVGDIAATAYNNSGWLIGASYQVNSQLTFKAGSSHYTLSAPSDSQSAATLSSINGFTIAPNIVNYNGTHVSANLNWIGLNYQIRPDLTVYSGYYRANYNSYTSLVSTAFTSTPGSINWASFLIDYQLDEAKDVYLAVANLGFNNTSTSTAITGATKASSGYSPINSNTLVGLGFRWKF